MTHPSACSIQLYSLHTSYVRFKIIIIIRIGGNLVDRNNFGKNISCAFWQAILYIVAGVI